MDTEIIDHYAVLGLPSGEEGANLDIKEIKKAYFSKALVIHPDKTDDPNADADFKKLNASYEILKNEDTRKLFDDLLRSRQVKLQRKRKSMSDLEERERAAHECDPGLKAKFKEEKISRKLQEEINIIRAQCTKKGPDVPASKKNGTSGGAQSSNISKGTTLDREKILKVSWEKTGVDYGVERLKDIFSKFGMVEYVNSKKKGSAVVAMATRDAAGMCWEISQILCWFYLFNQHNQLHPLCFPEHQETYNPRTQT